MRKSFFPKEDHELVKDYASGDEDAFAELMHRHQSRIYTTISLIVKDQDEAEDLFQEAMIKIIRLIQAGKYDEKGKFAPWALKIAKNIAIDHYRRDRRSPEMLRENDHYDVFNTIGKTEDNIEDQIIRDENILYVQNLMSQIPEIQREVLVMRHYAGLSFKEIAEAQGTNINTALGRMRYALMNLRRCAGMDPLILKNNGTEIFE